MTESPEPKIDRLSALLDAVAPVGRLCDPRDVGAMLVVSAQGVTLRLAPGGAPEVGGLAAATFDLAAPLDAAAARVTVPRAACPQLDALATVFAAEAAGGRCGSGAAASRLAEAMLALALRRAIELGAAPAGLLAGLAHPRLHRMLAAIHADPARPWTVEAMAETAGMSRSRFMAVFAATLGVGPSTYLARWRMALARRELAAGRAVKEVARKVGYRSAAAFSRAFARHTGGQCAMVEPPA